jgi:hypothetical protein
MYKKAPAGAQENSLTPLPGLFHTDYVPGVRFAHPWLLSFAALRLKSYAALGETPNVIYFLR